MKEIYVTISAVVIVLSVVPYLRDMLNHTTKPNLVSWITWTALTGLATAAEISAKEYGAAFFTGAASFATLMVVLVGLRTGYVKYDRFDIVCQVCAVVGLTLWLIFNAPVIAVLIGVSIDFVASLPTLRHSWLKPFEETWQTYAWGGLAGGFALLGITTYNTINLAYAMYVVSVNVGIVIIIIKRRQIIGV